jgi:aryl-alcohol dehydrogenase-like predicted oxidoreductase
MNNSLSKKLCLGTAQFGLDYGINNSRGKIPENEVFEILDYALDNGIEFIDSAYNYGDSEKVIGKFIKSSSKGKKLKIISKLPPSNNVYEIVEETLNNLCVKKIYGYLVHNFRFFLENPKIWEKLLKLKNKGKTEKIGFSLYYPEEYYKLEKLEVDVLQIPYNIFDQRFSNLLPEFKEKGIEVYARSLFLQGLVFKNPEELKGNFFKLKARFIYLNSLSKEFNLPLSSIFLNFATINRNIDKVIIGIDNLNHLKMNIDCLKHQDIVKNFYSNLLELKEEDEDIILPTKWQK